MIHLKKTLPALLALCFSVPLMAQFAVGHTTVTFFDATRNRDILTEIYYPADVAGDDVATAEGTYPSVVFGHGFLMVWSAYANVWEHLVPQGYIMLFPRTEGGILPNHAAFGEDLAFLSTAIEDLGNDASSVLFNHVAPECALMGHSMGGGCAFLAAEAADVESVIGLAPAETNTSAIAAAAAVTEPTLVLSGTSDGVTPPSEHHIPIYNATAAGCKHLVNIIDGSHCYFANTNFNCDFGEFNPGDLSREAQQQIMNNLLDPWLEQHLKSGCTAYDDFVAVLNAESQTTSEGSCEASGVELEVPAVEVIDCHPVEQEVLVAVTLSWTGNAENMWTVNGQTGILTGNPDSIFLEGIPAEGQSLDLTISNGSCQWSFPSAFQVPSECEIIYGCTYPFATNFNPDANVDDGMCDFAGPNCPTDVNFDGITNSADLLVFLGSYGNVCE